MFFFQNQDQIRIKESKSWYTHFAREWFCFCFFFRFWVQLTVSSFRCFRLRHGSREIKIMPHVWKCTMHGINHHASSQHPWAFDASRRSLDLRPLIFETFLVPTLTQLQRFVFRFKLIVWIQIQNLPCPRFRFYISDSDADSNSDPWCLESRLGKQGMLWYNLCLHKVATHTHMHHIAGAGASFPGPCLQRWCKVPLTCLDDYVSRIQQLQVQMSNTWQSSTWQSSVTHKIRLKFQNNIF